MNINKVRVERTSKWFSNHLYHLRIFPSERKKERLLQPNSGRGKALSMGQSQRQALWTESEKH